MESILISIVIPVYSGENYLLNLFNQIIKVRDEWLKSNAPIQLVECIFVDDASTDHSAEILEQISKEYSWVRHITLSKNFGQHQATAVGLLHSCGDWVVTMDEDLQHPPEIINLMLKKAITDHKDIIYVSPTNKVHRSLYRDLFSKFFKIIMAWLTENSHVRHFNSFRLIRGSIARTAASIYSSDGYLDVVLGWFTESIGIIELEINDIRFQKNKLSGYNFSKLLSHARRLVVSSQLKVLRIGLILGLSAMAFSFFYSLFVIYLKFHAKFNVPGWTSLMISVLFFSGLILFILGIILEYFRVMLNHSNAKPSFHILDRSKDKILQKYFIDTKISYDHRINHDSLLQSE